MKAAFAGTTAIPTATLRPAPDQAQAQALAQACQALWSATLSLMVAFMSTPAPAHRLLLAKRIARNFETLKGESCFSPETRASFVKLAAKWNQKVGLLSPREERPQGGIGALVPTLLRALGARA